MIRIKGRYAILEDEECTEGLVPFEENKTEFDKTTENIKHEFEQDDFSKAEEKS